MHNLQTRFDVEIHFEKRTKIYFLRFTDLNEYCIQHFKITDSYEKIPSTCTK